MGIYLNPGSDGFEESIRSEIYVDKTGLIACTNGLINTKEKFVCVSRPRRFGKSMALEMLAAYYSRDCDSGDLFSGLKIAQDASFEEHLNRYNVIYLNMQEFLIGARGQDVTGYLGYDTERGEAFIPNKEIIGEFENAMSTGGWAEVMHVLKASEK